MSRWVTFHYDMIREHVSDLKVHPDKDTALKYVEIQEVKKND